eukprot:1228528-Pyramimonas_sp.AAC.1
MEPKTPSRDKLLRDTIAGVAACRFRHHRGCPTSIFSTSCQAGGEDAARFPRSLQGRFQAALGR